MVWQRGRVRGILLLDVGQDGQKFQERTCRLVSEDHSFRKSSRHETGLTGPAVAQEEGRCVLLLREQARKVDLVRLTVVLNWDLEVGHSIDALLVLVPVSLISLAPESHHERT